MKKTSVNIRQLVQVSIGNAATLVGELSYVKQGARERRYQISMLALHALTA